MFRALQYGLDPRVPGFGLKNGCSPQGDRVGIMIPDPVVETGCVASRSQALDFGALAIQEQRELLCKLCRREKLAANRRYFFGPSLILPFGIGECFERVE